MNEADLEIGGMPVRILHNFMVNWKNWMQSNDERLGYPRKAIGCVGGGYSSTFEDLCDAADSASAKAVDALVESLTNSEKMAVYRVYLRLVCALRDFETSYARALEKIARGMVARGFW